MFAIIILTLVDNTQIPTAYAVKENPSLEKSEFKVLTKAVCEEKSEHIICQDRLFIKCNDKEYIISKDNLDNFTGCNNIKLNFSNIKVNGSTLFKKEWVDPRE